MRRRTRWWTRPGDGATGGLDGAGRTTPEERIARLEELAREEQEVVVAALPLLERLEATVHGLRAGRAGRSAP